MSEEQPRMVHKVACSSFRGSRGTRGGEPVFAPFSGKCREGGEDAAQSVRTRINNKPAEGRQLRHVGEIDTALCIVCTATLSLSFTLSFSFLTTFRVVVQKPVVADIPPCESISSRYSAPPSPNHPSLPLSCFMSTCRHIPSFVLASRLSL